MSIMFPRVLPAVWVGLLAASFAASFSAAQEYRVDVIDGGPPADRVAEEIRAELAKTGLKVVRGSSRTVCEFWPCASWPVIDGFQATTERLYPFEPGQLIGVLRLRRRGNDFRDQQISGGVYTLRYALQPIDGNHEGTSPTRDFLVLVNAEDDSVKKAWTVEALMKASAAAAQSSHPAMLCLQRVDDKRPATPQAAMRHDERHDWWILGWVGQAESKGTQRPLPIDLVVVGHAEE
jgi:hypothetical protein